MDEKNMLLTPAEWRGLKASYKEQTSVCSLEVDNLDDWIQLGLIAKLISLGWGKVSRKQVSDE
jgi:hypothetical protein